MKLKRDYFSLDSRVKRANRGAVKVIAPCFRGVWETILNLSDHLENGTVDNVINDCFYIWSKSAISVGVLDGLLADKKVDRSTYEFWKHLFRRCQQLSNLYIKQAIFNTGYGDYMEDKQFLRLLADHISRSLFVTREEALKATEYLKSTGFRAPHYRVEGLQMYYEYRYEVEGIV